MSARHLALLLLAVLGALFSSGCTGLRERGDAQVTAVPSPPATAGQSQTAPSPPEEADVPVVAGDPAAPELSSELPPELAFLEEEEDFENDPYEAFNRRMFRFNDFLDRNLMRPLAETYERVAPAPIKAGIGNFFRNLFEPAVALNNLLQGKPGEAASDAGRFLLNSTIGVAGLFDVATRAGLPRHVEDFGQTLGVWGAEEGPFLVLPFFGPRTIRDSFGLVVDWYTDPLTYVDDDAVRWGARAVNYVDNRAQLLQASRVLEQATDDEYLFLREAYRQRRRHLTEDRDVP